MKPKNKLTKARKRNPNDATHRNIRALKRRVERLESWNEAITLDLSDIYESLGVMKPKRKGKR